MVRRPRALSNWHKISLIDDSGAIIEAFELDSLGQLKEKLGRQKNRRIHKRRAFKPVSQKGNIKLQTSEINPSIPQNQHLQSSTPEEPVAHEVDEISSITFPKVEDSLLAPFLDDELTNRDQKVRFVEGSEIHDFNSIDEGLFLTSLPATPSFPDSNDEIGKEIIFDKVLFSKDFDFFFNDEAGHAGQMIDEFPEMFNVGF
ncbi:hypothetical protein TRFO_39641 [Tritrichomonas foetus]|uniref:Uncharacterized protein n=1 Tax=Tritrichomonas foetus TaxID=1144522 RepID=A0A1J4J663_9EUKA|nr:hypothetical protein TRFO_39641 [Tritrichomonas foetus]|eukprot:OHS94153.1 hypothetical protein TRFO_39641 [Tritrichomonas foetus]